MFSLGGKGSEGGSSNSYSWSSGDGPSSQSYSWSSEGGSSGGSGQGSGAQGGGSSWSYQSGGASGGASSEGAAAGGSNGAGSSYSYQSTSGGAKQAGGSLSSGSGAVLAQGDTIRNGYSQPYYTTGATTTQKTSAPTGLVRGQPYATNTIVEQPIVNVQPVKEIPVPVKEKEIVAVEVPVPVETTKVIEVEREVPVFIEPASMHPVEVAQKVDTTEKRVVLPQMKPAEIKQKQTVVRQVPVPQKELVVEKELVAVP